LRKFLLGILCGVILAGIVLVVLAFAAIRTAGERQTVAAVAPGSTLMLRLEGPVGETLGDDMPIPFFESQSPISIVEIWSALRTAAKDDRIKAVALMPRGVGAGWAKLAEIRAAIEGFKKSGKPVYCWLRTPGMREYYLAAAADKIYLAEQDFLDVKGLAAELSFYKGTLGKIGVEVEIEHMGKYKDAGDAFSRDSSTPETREVIDAMLDHIYGTAVQAIAAGRKTTPEAVRALIDQGPFIGPKALKAGLVDGLVYEDQFKDELEKKLGQSELTAVGLRTYVREAASKGGKGSSVAWIVGSGAITRGHGGAFDDADGIRSEDFVGLLRQAANDEGIKAAIVRVDSPGGDAIASDEILREMKLLARKKPLVISMSDVAASGGYYIAATGDPIVAYPNTITGSIGVVYGKPNLKGLYDKIGLKKEIYQRGKNAAFDSDYGPMTPAARAALREGIAFTYDSFLERVASARKMKVAEVAPLAQGRVWMGAEGKDRKLVDELGGVDKAIEMVKTKAKIGKDEPVRLVPFPPRRNLLSRLFSKSPEAAIESRAKVWLTQHGFPTLDALTPPTGVLRLMPYRIEIR